MKSIFCSSRGYKFRSWHPHTFAALLYLIVFASLHKGKQLKEDMHFLSLAAIDYAHGHNPNPQPPLPTFSNALDNRKSPVGRPFQVHPHSELLQQAARPNEKAQRTYQEGLLSNLFQDEREERLKTWEVLNDYSRFNFSPENSNSSTRGILSPFTSRVTVLFPCRVLMTLWASKYT